MKSTCWSDCAESLKLITFFGISVMGEIAKQSCLSVSLRVSLRSADLYSCITCPVTLLDTSSCELFLKMKKEPSGRHTDSHNDVFAAVDYFLDIQDTNSTRSESVCSMTAGLRVKMFPTFDCFYLWL